MNISRKSILLLRSWIISGFIPDLKIHYQTIALMLCHFWKLEFGAQNKSQMMAGKVCLLTSDVFCCCFILFQLSPQITCPKRCNITLVTFLWLFSTVRFSCRLKLLYSTVCFQMCPQFDCPCGCKVRFVAFVQPFSIMCFQMYFQITCPSRCKVTMATLAWLFSTVRCQMLP